MQRSAPLRGALLVDAVVFLSAALFNMGVRIPLGFADLRFSDPVWQAGTGEAIIGVTLLAAGSRHGLGCHGWRSGCRRSVSPSG